MQASLHRHRTDLERTGGRPIAPPLQHHLPHHFADPGFEQAQGGGHIVVAARQLHLGTLRFHLQPFGIQGQHDAQPPRVLQLLPLGGAEPQALTQLLAARVTAMVLPELAQGPLDLQLAFPKAAWQPQAWGHIPEVVEDRTAHMGSGKGLEGGA